METSNINGYYRYAKDFKNFPDWYSEDEDEDVADEMYHDLPDIITSMYKLSAKICSISSGPESELVILTSIEKLPTIINSIMDDWANRIKSTRDTCLNNSEYTNPFPTDITVNKLEQLFAKENIIKIVVSQYFNYKKYTIIVEQIHED